MKYHSTAAAFIKAMTIKKKAGNSAIAKKNSIAVSTARAINTITPRRKAGDEPCVRVFCVVILYSFLSPQPTQPVLV